MVDIRIRDLPDASPAVPTDFVAIDNGTTRKVPIADLVSAGRPLASQAEAEAGTDPTKAMTPLTTKQHVDSRLGVDIQQHSANLDTLSGVVPGAAGAAILALALAADVRNFLDTAPYVATRTALKALDTTKDAVAILTETGREGIFNWKTGDFSAQIAADTLEGIYVKADAIAATSGAWVRVFFGAVDPRWFGAFGNGVADDTAAFQAAVSVGRNVEVVPPSVKYVLTAPVIATTPTAITSTGYVEIEQTTAGVPAFISDTNNFTFDADINIISTQPKPGTASSGPYRAGIVYHSAILQVNGDDFTVNGLKTYNFTAGVGFHGTQAGSTGLAARAKVTNCYFDKYDFGILGRQFDGMFLDHLEGRDAEETVEPGHIVYITDRSAQRSRGLIISNIYDLDNTTAETVKVRNVEGFDINAMASENCVRGIAIGFSRLGTVRGGTINMSLHPADTQQGGIVIDDSEDITFVSPIVDVPSAVANVSGYGIRVRTDLGTQGNRSITFLRPVVVAEWTDNSGSIIPFSPYFVQGNSDVTFLNPKFVNRGTTTPSWPMRVDTGTSDIKIIEPELVTSAATNQTRFIRNRPGAASTRVVFSQALTPAYVAAYVTDEAGTCIVERPHKWEIIAHSAVAASHTGSTTETTLATITVPANAMGANGKLRITTMWSFTGTNTKTSRVRWAGANLQGITATTQLNARYLTEIENRNATNSQVAAQGNFSGIGAGGGAALTFATDTTADVTILIQGTLATAAESVTLESYTVELCRIP